MFEINVYQAALVIEGKKIKLTKSVARQFPIIGGSKRADMVTAGKKVPAPLCKVLTKTLISMSAFRWLVLVPDDVAGLVWTPPAVFAPAITYSLEQLGIKLDDLESIPTIIL